MIRRTPPFPRPAMLLAFLGLASIALLVHACSEPQAPTTTKEITGPRLANNAASCDAPCVQVEVTASGQGPSQPIDGIVVTLWRAGESGDGAAFHATTVNGGIATFDLTNQLLSSLDGFCAVARPLTDEQDAQTFISIDPTNSVDQLNIIPNAAGVYAPSAPWQGSVSVSENRSTVLNKSNLVSNCLNWETAADAPFAVDENTSIRVRMTMNAATASIVITCLFPDNSGEDCQSWTAIPLEDVDFPSWAPTLPDGVKKGFLASVGLGNSPAVNDGLAFGETYFVEVAQGEYTSSKLITTSGTSGSNQSTSTNATAELATILCVVNDGSPYFFETNGEVTSGMDIQSPVLDGYAGLKSLETVLFYPDSEKVVIAFDYLDLGGDLTANFQVRARENPDHPDMYSTTITKSVKYDFSTCPAEPTVLSQNTETAIMISVTCRADPLASNRYHVEITATVPAFRFIEWAIQTASGDKHPETAKKNASSALRPINQPYFDQTCPLEDSGFGQTNDPKVWGSISTTPSE